ncbi:melanopsin-B-like [Diadema antillarum]|uniref:melanopsin-B-like n=1 Tax=Diadema antillarum TaxID=105358 RepID=UPI003A89EDEA
MDKVGFAGENVSSSSYLYRTTVIVSSFAISMVVVGIVENLVIFLAFAMSRKLQTATNIFLINLGISQTVICLVWIFFAAINLNDKNWLNSDATCQVLYALSPIVTSCMSLTIMVVALNRYVLITKTKETYSRVFSRRNVGCILVFCWFFPTVTMVIPQVSDHIVRCVRCVAADQGSAS